MSEIKSLAYDNLSTELNIEASAEMSDLSFFVETANNTNITDNTHCNQNPMIFPCKIAMTNRTIRN